MIPDTETSRLRVAPCMNTRSIARRHSATASERVRRPDAGLASSATITTAPTLIGPGEWHTRALRVIVRWRHCSAA
jgi:hypothetical protein